MSRPMRYAASQMQRPSSSLLHYSTRRAARPFLYSQTRPRPYGGFESSNYRRIAAMTSGARGFSLFPGKIIAKMIRVPAAAGGAVVAGLAYVNYQVQEAAGYTQKQIDAAAEWISGTANNVKEGLEGLSTPEWFNSLFSSGTEGSSKSASEGSAEGARSDGNSGEEPSGGSEGGGGGEDTALAAAGTAAAVSSMGDSTDTDERIAASTSQMMLLTKKMIEIRGILQEIASSGAGSSSLTRLQLPSIVVIGSQSSGKSSVLEAIVGHEFLPKGNNMVTRRPIELTLVNSPDAAAEYGEFPALKLGKITDFSQIQRTLTDLNLAIPDSEAVSSDPIRLNIYSPHIPDLTLIDLPGYIQLAAADQPESLKSKISALCDKYIAAPNIILAISAADVDLANSTALRASRRVDPRGERTIGVITKMDLVDPKRALEILQNINYPLQMGYVGVISRIPTSRPSNGLLFRLGSGRESTDIGAVIARNEEGYFESHPEFSRLLEQSSTSLLAPASTLDKEQPASLGVINLRNKLMRTLEKTMAKNLQPTCDAIHQELEETVYQFKVEYNDRPLTAESYLAQSLDAFKLSFKEFASKFGREQVKALLRSELDQRVLDLLAQRYWNRLEESKAVGEPSTAGSIIRAVSDLPNAGNNDVYWLRQLDACVSSLTKSGVGRTSTTLVSNALSGEMEHLLNSGSFKSHPFVKTVIQDATNEILNSRFYSTADQVENCIKPYKYEVEVEDREWSRSREHAFALLKEELRQCEHAYGALQKSVGGNKKLMQVESFVEKHMKGQAKVEEANEVYGFSQALLEKGREGLFLSKRADILRLRMQALKSKQCRSKENKYYCPEIFLDVVADKLTQTAVLFLNVELLSDFYYHLPRELDSRVGHGLSATQIEQFAREDLKVRRHLELQEKKQKLELASEKIEGVIAMQKTRH
ncbi:hypothetical protein BZA70DRAFT_272796 [Myxozyma melibiosi]|uniref:dynamin GTPase n=1 Tax=Myxozyma melibiosi TaxID=54550 RepID=A0ABR1FDX3_9ASCO